MLRLEKVVDRIQINSLRARCIIGAIDYERREKQEILITLSLWVDLSIAGKTDRLGDTIDYQKICDRIVYLVENSSYFLIEALAEKIAETCLEHPKAKKVQVMVTKPSAIATAQSAGVEIIRSKSVSP